MTHPVWIYAPSEPGQYTLDFCVVHLEGRTFAESAPQPVTVAAASDEEAQHQAVENV